MSDPQILPTRAGGIDLRRLPGFANTTPPAADWVERDRANARRAEQAAAGLMLLAAAAIGAVFLFAPDAWLGAVMAVRS